MSSAVVLPIVKHNLDSMFSLRPPIVRRVVASLQIATLGRCLHTKKLVSNRSGRTWCHALKIESSSLPRTFASKVTKVNCWKCNKESNTTTFCEHCSAIQKPRENASYFDLFELRETFDTDPVELSLRYRKLQSLLHPDKFANSSTVSTILML